MDTDNKTAVVTGGANGIGAALARAIVQSSGRAVIVDIDEAGATSLADELGDAALALACDVSDVASVNKMAQAAWEWTGGVDLVFANAGVGLARSLLKSTEAEFDATIGINLKGVWATVKAFAPRMIEAGREGHFCLTGSEHSLGMQHTNNGIYTASKHGVLALADVWRNELPDTIGMSVLCPGLTATNIVDTSPAATGLGPAPERRAFGRAMMAAGKPPAEVAQATLAGIARGDFFIVTQASSFKAAKTRQTELTAAFEAQAPMTSDAMKYDVDVVMKRLRDESA